MAVYREGYSAVDKIMARSEKVFIDARDYGAPVKIGDDMWNEVKQLTAYAEDKKAFKYTEDGVEGDVTLIDEWAVADKRKTEEEATDTFRVRYTKLDHWKGKPYLMDNFRQADGFVTIFKLTSK